MSSPEGKFPIVGIGASAGGIQALEGFFKGIAKDCGMAFVVITHLSPDRESLLHEIVARYTDMPVTIAEDDVRVDRGNVYVLPQNAILEIENGHLQIHRPNLLRRERKPIDIFFSTLAKDQGEYAAGVILSGGDGDGTLGIKAIKEHGGLTVAQAKDESGPRYPDMPETAIASGLVDLAMPAGQMGEKLADFARSFDRLGDLTRKARSDGEDTLRAEREAIYALLRKQAGHDFSGYKTKTFIRRVHRRMQVLQIDTIEAYVGRLRSDPAEVSLLFRDLLINVTNFFRDTDAFKALEATVIPRLFEGQGADGTVRVWVPGCATGEEVYSIAILMREHMATLSSTPRVQIFASDIDEPALSVGRTARYPEALLDGVSPERRERFFTSDGSSYVVNKDVRELCIFSPHSVIRDPPFSRMDLVSCRNLLIYFGPEVQSRVVPTFHYALKPGGYLFLGTSESITPFGDLFATVDKKSRIFQSRENGNTRRLPPIALDISSDHLVGDNPARYRGNGTFPLRQMVESHVLERFAPAHVVVNAEGDIVYYSPRTGKYLEASQGAPTRQLLTLARKGLRLELRAAFRQALESREAVTRENIAVDADDDRVQMISLMIEPIDARAGAEALFLVLFTDVGPVQHRTEIESRSRRNPDASQVELERELRDTRERLQAMVEEYETALEELKSSNEELVSVNEEAQSTNEELEASKEEMQSLNEELNTINAELADKIEELDRANGDLKNLFESTRIATVFLDRNLVIRTFTPAASKFFNLIPGDAGRPLTDLSGHLAYPEFKDHIRAVFDTGEMIEHQLAGDEEREHYLVRLLPYEKKAGDIEGVVIAVVDVTSLKEAEAHQKVLISELNHRVKNMLAVVISIARQTVTQASSPEAYHEALEGRLHAMARSYALLSRENWTEASVSDLVHQELDPFRGGDRISVGGPEARLKPKQGLSIGMVLHELATNAAKYGALSVPDGRVEVSWSAAKKEGRFKFRWRECDGPEIAEPSRIGFGLKLVKREVEYNLQGTAEIAFKPDGLAVELEFPFEG